MMYKTRRIDGAIAINGYDIWADIKGAVTEAEYTDVASGETDSFDFTLTDSDERFITDWDIDKGSVVEASFKLINWDNDGDVRILNCGSFLCDAKKIEGMPLTVTIKSLALPQNGTKKTQKWENLQVSAIAEEICQRNGCDLKYYADDIVVKSVQQSRERDIEFLFKLCSDYGFGMKVYRHCIIIFDKEAQEKAEPAGETDILTASEFSVEDNEEGIYTGAKCNYKLEGEDDERTADIGGGDNILVLETTASSLKEAELKAKAAMYSANAERVKLSFRLTDKKPIYANTTRNIKGLGVYSGKYAIDKVIHTLSGKNLYIMSVEAHAVELDKEEESRDTEEQNDSASLEAGATVALENEPLYISSDAKSPVRYISGTYYFYDGISFR